MWTDQTVNLQIIDKYICSPTTGFELTLFIHCSYNSLAWCPAPNSILVISWSVYIGVALSIRIVTLFNIDTINDKVRHCFCGLFMTPTLVLFVITRLHLLTADQEIIPRLYLFITNALFKLHMLDIAFAIRFVCMLFLFIKKCSDIFALQCLTRNVQF